MIKIIKWVNLGALGIVFYAFAGTMTYRYHEGLFPGSDDNSPNASKILGVLWPAGLPMTAGLHAARLIK